VRDAGGSGGEPRDEPYGRIADCLDPQGLAFAVFGPAPGAEPGPRTPLNGAREGDLSYLTLETPDRAAAMTFYGAVLGWRAEGELDPDDVHPMLGVTDVDVVAPRAVPCWKVDDVHAAVDRVRAAGGTAAEPDQRSYGLLATCTDDQEARFYLSDA